MQAKRINSAKERKSHILTSGQSQSAFTSQEHYWRERLKGAVPVALPTRQQQPARPRFRRASQKLLLPTSMHRALEELSHRQEVTLCMTLLTAFQALLARYSDRQDIATLVSSRTTPGGSFKNIVLVRTDLSANPGFLEMLGRVQKEFQDACAHQDIPFEQPVEMLRDDLLSLPLFQSASLLPDQSLRGEEPDSALPHLLETPPAFDLIFEVQAAAEGLECRVDYNASLFEKATIARLLTHWQTLLMGVIFRPTLPLAELPLLTAYEKKQQLYLWNETNSKFAEDKYIHQRIEYQVQHNADAIAVVCDDECLTYEQLNRRANRIAHVLVAYGVGPDIPVLVLIDRSLLWLTALLAVLKANGVYLPLDPLSVESQLSQVLQQSRCPLILTSTAWLPLLSSISETSFKHQILDISHLDLLPQKNTYALTNIPSRYLPSHLAYIIPAAGNLLAVEQRGMSNYIYSQAVDVGITARDIVAQNSSQQLGMSLWQSLAALLFGGKVQIFRDEVASNPVHLLKYAEERGITVLQLVPTMLHSIIDILQATQEHRPGLLPLRWLIASGAALTTELCQRWLELYPHVLLLHTYSPTEGTADQCHLFLRIPLKEENRHLLVPIGFPTSNIRIYVLDHMLNLLPAGVVGELYIGGLGVGRGFLNDPIRTAAAFVPNPFGKQEGERLYKTRVQVRYLPDSSLEIFVPCRSPVTISI